MRQCSHVWPFAGLFYVFPSESFPAGSQCAHVYGSVCVCMHACVESIFMVFVLISLPWNCHYVSFAFSIFSRYLRLSYNEMCLFLHWSFAHFLARYILFSSVFLCIRSVLWLLLISECVSRTLGRLKRYSVHLNVRIYECQYNKIVNTEKTYVK